MLETRLYWCLFVVIVAVWSHNDVLLLIDSYRHHQQDFRSPTLRKNEVWDTVAQEMNVVKNADCFMGGMCQKKWSNMEIRYKEIKDKMGKTGRGGQNWAYFEQMHGLLGCRASVRSLSSTCKPSSASVLPQLSVSVSSAAADKNSSFVTYSAASSSIATSHLPPSSYPFMSSSSVSCVTQPITSSSIISPPSDSSDDELHDKEAMKGILETSAKCRKLGQGRSGVRYWAEKMSNDTDKRHEKIDQRLKNMEKIEMERVTVLKEMKDLMKVWVTSMTNKQQNEG